MFDCQLLYVIPQRIQLILILFARTGKGLRVPAGRVSLLLPLPPGLLHLLLQVDLATLDVVLMIANQTPLLELRTRRAGELDAQHRGR